MNIAYSPCPNDTFVFHALAHGLIEGAPELEVQYADIDITNTLAAKGEGPEVMKISFAALPYVLNDYALIPCGGALGRGCGPLILSADEKKPEELAGKVVAVPSERSTAYMLFRFWAKQMMPDSLPVIKVMPFDDIMPAVQEGRVDAGLVIHEARFTYQNYNLHMMEDLGDWWEKDTGFPIPLGAIIAKRSLDTDKITEWIRASVDYAWEHPDSSKEYVMEHAQEMSEDVADSHIDLYVNEFTRDLGKDGFAAVESLLARAAAEEIVPAVDLSKLRK